MAKACHHSMSSLKEPERWKVSWSEGAVVARSIILHRTTCLVTDGSLGSVVGRDGLQEQPSPEQVFELERRPLHFVLGKGHPEVIAERDEGLEVVVTVGGRWGTSWEEIIKVLGDGVDTMLCGNPLNGVSKAAEDERG